jgi:hypothetical protein
LEAAQRDRRGTERKRQEDCREDGGSSVLIISLPVGNNQKHTINHGEINGRNKVKYLKYKK